MRLIVTHVAELAVMAKHLNAMDAELSKAREEQSFSWGDGMWLTVNEIPVFTDADEQVGTFKLQEFGYDFEAGGS